MELITMTGAAEAAAARRGVFAVDEDAALARRLAMGPAAGRADR